ncbi:hypothetical protein ACFWY5_50870 [Nonomuraea sp. NPDC059007]|uniref:hypothetical protein n=1 Tax=Nonomuraea sp. NPDC059007 TaxID=3346692 RepID=UPI003687B45F
MPRMIERWFPCAEVSDAAGTGWGSGNTESSLWVWFAKRPTVQAKAAVLTSLLPWPDTEAEQDRLRTLVRGALQGHTAMQTEVEAAIRAAHPDGATVLDPFSGRAMIPLEASRLRTRAYGIDYSPFATLGGWLLAEAPFQDWSSEPALPYTWPAARAPAEDTGALFSDAEIPRRRARSKHPDRLVDDVELFLSEVGIRFRLSMAEFYPLNTDRSYPWGYLWASTLPCDNCGRRFPLVGELKLRLPGKRKDRDGHTFQDLGQSFRIEVDHEAGTFRAVPHDGGPSGQPTRQLAGRSKYASEGKIAVCPFCAHTHPKAVHTRLSKQGLRRDALLIAADIDENGLKVFRKPEPEEIEAAKRAALALEKEEPFGFLPACPDERIPPGNTWTIQSVNYGDTTYGDLCEARQSLGLVRLARAINEVSAECQAAEQSPEYVKVLAGYATAVMMRKIRRSTRGARLEVGRDGVGDIFVNQSAVTVSYDWFESGLSDGPGSWSSLAKKTVTTLRNIRTRASATPGHIERGTAVALSFAEGSVDAVVTDPPYDDMIDYSDSSDLFYVWAKRAMAMADPEFAMSLHPDGVQEKDDEIIIKRGGVPAGDHRDRTHYSKMIERAYAEMARVVSPDGVVTIVFGSGDRDVWLRMLSALTQAELVVTGSWPAKTEAGGGGAGSANIVTTVTLACRKAASDRGVGRQAAVESQIKAEIKERISLWLRSGLAITDMLMASVGPAMEVVGRYREILDNRGEKAGLDRFLNIARRAVREVSAVPVDSLRLEEFDSRTIFALWWVRVFKRDLRSKADLGWELMAADLSPGDVRNLIAQEPKGVRFALASQAAITVGPDSPTIDVALAMAAAYTDGIDAVGAVLATAGKLEPDEQLWAALAFLESMFPHPDPDFAAWSWLNRNREPLQRSAVEQHVMGRPEAPVRRRTTMRKQSDTQEGLF